MFLWLLFKSSNHSNKPWAGFSYIFVNLACLLYWFVLFCLYISNFPESFLFKLSFFIMIWVNQQWQLEEDLLVCVFIVQNKSLLSLCTLHFGECSP